MMPQQHFAHFEAACTALIHQSPHSNEFSGNLVNLAKLSNLAGNLINFQGFFVVIPALLFCV